MPIRPRHERCYPLNADELAAIDVQHARSLRLIFAMGSPLTTDLVADIRAEAAEKVAEADAYETENPTPDGEGRSSPRVLLNAHQVIQLCDLALEKKP